MRDRELDTISRPSRFIVPRGPQRIVCLTEEPTEILYALGEHERIVGISAYTVRPARAKAEHPVVSAFIDGSVTKIQKLEPDLVIGFSDIQAKLAHDLIKANLQVLIFNQRSVSDILGVVQDIANLVGAGPRGRELVKATWKDSKPAHNATRRIRIALACFSRNGTIRSSVRSLGSAN